ncbi:MAG: tetratricopeptide repeat protein [Deltaproteobacteria bacterium]|nr:tetratricopeptide repeat protein [Deltaproteobacteria bacterium]
MTDTVLDPNPGRRRFLAETLLKFINNKLSIADLDGIPPKKMQQVAELGYVKLKHGRLKEAREIFEMLSELDHLNAYYRTALGSIFQKQGQYVDAIVEYSQALFLRPKDLPSLVNRGEILLRTENFKKAAEDFRSAILMDNKGTNLWANRARSLVIALKRNLDLKKAALVPKQVPPSRSATRRPR